MNTSSKFSEESLRKIAEEKINYRISVKIHLAAFLLVNTMLFFINILTLPNDLWVIYPVFGWLIGLIIHSLAYILYARGIYPMAKRGFFYNLSAYLSTMLLLFLINYKTLNTLNWAFFPAIAWGFALLTHLIIYLLYFRHLSTEEEGIITKKQKAIEKELKKMREKLEKQKK